MTSKPRLALSAILASALVLLSVGAPASATSHRWDVQIGDQSAVVRASYPALVVPQGSDVLAINLPAGFDWAPADLAAPAPSVTWSIEQGGDVVGAGEDPPAPDSGILAGFGATGSIDWAELPTTPALGAGYTLRIHAVWAAEAPLNAGDVVDLVTPFSVTDDPGLAEVPVQLAFGSATSEIRTYDVTLDTPVAGGDTLHLSTSAAASHWTWRTGPDPDNAWATSAQVYGGIGAGAVDPLAPAEDLTGPFAVSTPDPTLLVVPLPDAVYAGSDTVAVSVSSRDDPASGPVVTVRVNVRTGFSAGVSPVAMTTRPVMTGTAMFGRALHVTSGAWAPALTGGWPTSSTTVAYQWYRGAARIAGATASSYVLGAADVGKVVAVRVTGHIAGYTPTTVALTGVLVRAAAAPKATTAPVLRGLIKVGGTVVVRSGTWTPVPRAKGFQWLRDGVAIPGARSSVFVVTKGMRGHVLSCRVVATLPGHTTGVAVTKGYVVR